MSENIVGTIVDEMTKYIDETNENDKNPFADSDDENSEALANTEKAPDVIASIYLSMSKIIEALNTDNLLLNQQVNKIRKELEFVCQALSKLKTHTEEMSATYTNEVGQINGQIETIKTDDLVQLRKKIDAVSSLQKHVIDTRNMLMQTLDSNIKIIKKELSELRNNRPFIRAIVEEEVKAYLATIDMKK